MHDVDDQMFDVKMKTVKSSDQFQSSYEEDYLSIDYKEEIRSILVYIGLITVLLFLFLIIVSLISKCLKILRHDTKTTRIKKQHQQMKYKQSSNYSLVNRQISASSVSSTAPFIKYPRCQMSSQSSLSETLRMIQNRERQLSSITNV